MDFIFEIVLGEEDVMDYRKNKLQQIRLNHLLEKYNHGNNIVGLFDVLPYFTFTTGETKCDY